MIQNTENNKMEIFTEMFQSKPVRIFGTFEDGAVFREVGD